MNLRYVWLGLVGTASIALATVSRPGNAQQTDPSAAATNQLRWTPHRVSTEKPADAAAASAPAKQSQPAPSTSQAAGSTGSTTQPPATVALPPGVPPVTGPTVPGYDARNPTNDVRQPLTTRFTRAFTLPAKSTPPKGDGYAPLRQDLPSRVGDWVSENRIAGSFGTLGDPADPDSIFGVNVIRAPQGESGRPVLAPEGMQRPAAPASVAARPSPRGGGLAPPFNPYAAPAARPGSNRIAMNVDGIPSVMSRGPQSAALDDSAVPNRLPSQAAPAAKPQTLPSPADPSFIPSDSPITIEMDMGGMPPEGYGLPMDQGGAMMPSDQGMWMGQYPAQVHVESFYDDPYACEDEECCIDVCYDGRICEWLRRFGRPYYGWKWYRDFTASAGVTSFTNATDLGLNGNFGVNEYLNWAMPFWNAFGVGWQLGVRGVQTDFQPNSVTAADGSVFGKNSRDQVFVTTGFFTRAFEGRGLQGGAVYDYLSDAWFNEVNVAQIRSELSYVWGYHEIGYWGAQNILEQNSLLSRRRTTRVTGTTVDIYAAFYRLHFGDANEWRAWGGATGNGEGIFGSSLRAPMSRSLALEGTFTYLVPKQSRTATIDNIGLVSTYSPAAWNVSVNLVYYPARRSRRSLASPYRPLFDVADNGSMIRSLVLPKK